MRGPSIDGSAVDSLKGADVRLSWMVGLLAMLQIVLSSAILKAYFINFWNMQLVIYKLCSTISESVHATCTCTCMHVSKLCSCHCKLVNFSERVVVYVFVCVFLGDCVQGLDGFVYFFS